VYAQCPQRSTRHTPAYIGAISTRFRANQAVISRVFLALCCGRIAHAGAHQTHLPREATIASNELGDEPADRGAVERRQNAPSECL